MKPIAGKNLSATVAPDASEGIEDDYETRGHLNTLMDAHHILNNPEKMAKVHKLAGRHDKAIQGIKSVEDLKNVYKQKYGLGHLASSPHQENEEADGHTGGDGDTGNRQNSQSKIKSAPHLKSSKKQISDIADGEPDNGTGTTGNGRVAKKGGHDKSSRQQKNDEVISRNSGSGNTGN